MIASDGCILFPRAKPKALNGPSLVPSAWYLTSEPHPKFTSERTLPRGVWHFAHSEHTLVGWFWLWVPSPREGCSACGG
eukprot:2101499-Alexandrium_andersonii.AAC.2